MTYYDHDPNRPRSRPMSRETRMGATPWIIAALAAVFVLGLLFWGLNGNMNTASNTGTNTSGSNAQTTGSGSSSNTTTAPAPKAPAPANK
jgi:cytoskeletal protein RodZ